MYKITETKDFRKLKIDNKLYKKIKDVVYPQLENNPFYGSNIKKLKGNFEKYYRYRIGNYRLFYIVRNEEIVVAIVNLKHRKDAYK